MPIAPDILRRLLVSRHLLASHEGRLTPQSDAMALAQVILTAHDAAELAIAAVATAVGDFSISSIGSEETLSMRGFSRTCRSGIA